MHIPIRPVDAIDAAKPDYVLILPWNLKDEIIQQMRHVADWGGKFIVADPGARRHRSEGNAAMKVVLFCGGLGTRIREYSETIPKPMIPVGHQPILWHVMQYYSEYGHKDFILTLGYKANIVKEFFLSYRPQVYADCVVSGFGSQRRAPGRATRGLAHHLDRYRHLAQHRASGCGRCGITSRTRRSSWPTTATA